jgi:uroporphyrinogen III methyltransferase/synthase
VSVGRVVLLGGARRDLARMTDRAREALAKADLVVAPEGLELGVATSRADLDEIVRRARAGETIAWVHEADDATRVALARAEVVVELAWLERGPLFGKRVVVTRTREQSEGTADLLRARGAEPIVVPAIELFPPKDPAKLAAAAARLGAQAIVVFTSANGVARVWDELVRQNRDARAFGPAKVAAIGPGTAAALAARGIVADVVAKEFKQEGLAEAITKAVPGGKALLLRAEVARDALPAALAQAGFEVEVVAAYETRPADPAQAARLARELEAGRVDAVTFTSSSTVSGVCDMLGARAPELLGKACVASIGPITAGTLRERGVRVDVSAGKYTLSGLLEALEDHFSAIDNLPRGRRSSV